MTETKVQKHILKVLETNGIIAVKTVIMNRAGIPDILACTKEGRFLAIEVKTETGKLSELQRHKLNNYIKNNAIAFVAYGEKDFFEKYVTYVHHKGVCPLIEAPDASDLI